LQDEGQQQPTVAKLFLSFSRISLTSFGGGLSGLFMHEFVERRRWISRDDFFDGLALAQALPGVNVKNLAIWIGYRVLGRKGAVAGFVGTIAPSGLLIIALSTVFDRLAAFPLTEPLLVGAGAAAVGISLSIGIDAAWSLPRRLTSLLLLAITFLAIAVFHLPLFWTVLAIGGAGFLWAYRETRPNGLQVDPSVALMAVFLPLSIITIGGGQSAMSEIQRQVVDVHHWLSNRDFLDTYTISRMTPGPGSLIATLIGWKVNGASGALVATLSLFGPTSFLIYAVAHQWTKHRGKRWQIALSKGLRPVAAGMILAATSFLMRSMTGGLTADLICLASAALLTAKRANPMLVIALGAVINCAVFLAVA
jgi:chromate transporter